MHSLIKGSAGQEIPVKKMVLSYKTRRYSEGLKDLLSRMSGRRRKIPNTSKYAQILVVTWAKPNSAPPPITELICDLSIFDLTAVSTETPPSTPGSPTACSSRVMKVNVLY